MVRVNGNFENNRNFLLTNEKEVKQEVVKEVAVDENKKVEFVDKGDELLKSTLVANDTLMFVNKERLDKQTEKELRELYQMAGISHLPLPTATEYARIAGATRADLTKFVEFETEKNIETLFGNAALMAALEDESII